MATDAQRLIAMSLGKIAASRGQRGGINLHKNLLVASVLHKARTIYMYENYSSMMESRRCQMESQEIAREAAEASENVVTTPTHEDHNTEHSSVAGTQEAQEGESEPSSCMYSSHPSPLPNYCDTQNTDNKENSPPQQVNRDSEMDSENCGRCTKRRLTEDTGEDNDSSPNLTVPCAKKVKYEHSTTTVINLESDSIVPLSKSCEKMQTEPSTQIINLVHSFNSGFIGLLHTSDSINTTDQGYSSSEEDDDEDVFGDATSITCSKSENSLISCSTQIKEAFETLARPIIALTV